QLETSAAAAAGVATAAAGTTAPATPGQAAGGELLTMSDAAPAAGAPADAAASSRAGVDTSLPEPADAAAAALARIPRRYETVLDWHTFSRWLAALDAAELFAFDT